jgi:hypothetical protein
VGAEVAYLDGKDLLARGISDPEPFKRALSLDPTHERARTELSRIETTIEERQSRLRWFAAAAAFVIVAILGLIVFGGRRQPRTA